MNTTHSRSSRLGPLDWTWVLIGLAPLAASVVFLRRYLVYGDALHLAVAVVGILALLAIGLLLRASRELKGGLLVSLVLLVLGLLAVDAVLGYLPKMAAQRQERALGFVPDSRERFEVLMDNRERSPNWYPHVPANTFIGAHLRVDGREILPLSGVANALTLGCNEGGFHSSYETGDYGFHNPAGVWSDLRFDSAFFVGDSFTQGACVNGGEDFVGQLRRHHPRVVNISAGGNGPLLELAAIREYVPMGRVDLVFWVYYEGNDLMDLDRDLKDPLLVRYLEPGYRQGLADMQAQVNAAVEDYVQRRIQVKLDNRPTFLANIRTRLWRLRQQWGRREAPVHAAAADEPERAREANLARFAEVLGRAKQDVAERGGQLVFVYLPEFGRFGPADLSVWGAQRDGVLGIVERLELPLVDFAPHLAAHEDPLDLFPLRSKGHYNARGYRLLADVVGAFLDARKGGALPRPRDP
jgi:hypothetical protein